MRPELKFFHSPDVDDVGAWTPDVVDCPVSYWLELDIGPPGDEAADIFGVYVTTDKDVRRKLNADGKAVRFIASPYEWSKVVAVIDGDLDACSASSWHAAVALLRRRFDWEYEGMIPFAGQGDDLR